MVELDTGIAGSELPGDGGVVLVATPLEGLHLTGERNVVGYPSTQTLAAEHTQLNLRHVEPTAMLGSVMKLQAFEYAPGHVLCC